MADDIITVAKLEEPQVNLRPVAAGMPLARIVGVLVQAGDQDAPHFAPGNAPDRDGTSFGAVDGRAWYRPDLRVADRPSSTGPYVWFLKDANGVVRLEFELEETGPGGLPDSALPLSTTIDSMSLAWAGADGPHARAFPTPTVSPSQDPTRQPHFLVRVGDQLAADEVATLYHALSQPTAAAHLTIGLSYGYWTDQPTGTPPSYSGEVGPGRGRAWLERASTGTLSPALRTAIVAGAADLPAASATAPTTGSAFAGTTGAATTAAVAEAVSPVVGLAGLGVARRSLAGQQEAGGGDGVAVERLAIDSSVFEQLVAANAQRQVQKDYHRVSYTRQVAFSFDEALEDNAPIYRSIKGEQLSGAWTSTVNGWVRSAPYPNTVYRLPDEMRLALNRQLGVPHVLPTLYRDDQGDAKVRVVLRVASWQDPAKVAAVGDDLGTAPVVVVGGYDSAVLSFTGAFPDEIHALSGTTVPVTLETGVEVTLDLTVDYYSFLCQLLKSPVGVTGQVAVTLGQTTPADGTPPQPIVRQVPVRLAFDSPASLELDVSVPADAVSPATVTVTNSSGAPVSVGGCLPVLLQDDANSVVPLEVFPATATSTFPVSLPVGASTAITVAPQRPETAGLWNAVVVQLTGLALGLDPATVLDRIYEVAPVGAIDWQLSLSSPPLATDPGPAKFASVIAVEVTVERADGSREVVHLARGAGSRATLAMHRTLAELTSPSGAVGTFSYTVRNFYDDHAGKTGPVQQAEGSDLFVYPNDPTGD